MFIICVREGEREAILSMLNCVYSNNAFEQRKCEV